MIPASSAPTANRLVEPLGEHLRAQVAHGGLQGWAPVVQAWMDSPQGRACISAVEARQTRHAVIYPSQVLRALALTPLEQVRVLILGQDPYHGPGQAQGLAFSVAAGTRVPPSLRHILQEVRRDTGSIHPAVEAGDLTAWAEQGVLLLNASLTVEDGLPASHARLGWSGLLRGLLQALALRTVDHAQPLVALLWGAHAQAWAPELQAGCDTRRLLLLQANHPSPLSARRPPVPFLGCGHFSQARDFLARQAPGLPPLNW